MSHDFIAIQHLRNTPERQVWRCGNCDSEAMFARGSKKEYVNRLMTARMKCIPPSEFWKGKGKS